MQKNIKKVMLIILVVILNSCQSIENNLQLDDISIFKFDKVFINLLDDDRIAYGKELNIYFDIEKELNDEVDIKNIKLFLNKDTIYETSKFNINSDGANYILSIVIDDTLKNDMIHKFNYIEIESSNNLYTYFVDDYEFIKHTFDKGFISITNSRLQPFDIYVDDTFVVRYQILSIVDNDYDERIDISLDFGDNISQNIEVKEIISTYNENKTIEQKALYENGSMFFTDEEIEKIKIYDVEIVINAVNSGNILTRPLVKYRYKDSVYNIVPLLPLRIHIKE